MTTISRLQIDGCNQLRGTLGDFSRQPNPPPSGGGVQIEGVLESESAGF